MKKAYKHQILRISGLIGLVATGIGYGAQAVQAKNDEVRVETIEIDFQEQQQQPADLPQTDAQATTLGIQNQFIFLFALTVLGMVGIAGIIRDFRKR